jgi:hypothetical protein
LSVVRPMDICYRLILLGDFTGRVNGRITQDGIRGILRLTIPPMVPEIFTGVSMVTVTAEYLFRAVVAAPIMAVPIITTFGGCPTGTTITEGISTR